LLTERTELLIREGKETEFSTAMKNRGIALLTSVPGVGSVNVGQGVENPSKFLLLVEWENMEAHKAFNKMPACTELRALIGPFSQGASMEHFEMS
jgi:heme-degrading monooxygenase HmoA